MHNVLYAGIVVLVCTTLWLNWRAIRFANQARAVLTDFYNARWSLGGRIRSPEQPAVYVMPPGWPLEKTCEGARIGWMDHCAEQAELLRAEGLHVQADRLYRLTVAANQTNLS